jgi:hypothetical protein
MIAVQRAMKPSIWLVSALFALLYGQNPPPHMDNQPLRLPSGKMQSEEILKADHEKSLKDAEELMKLAEDLKMELEKNDRYVLSLGAIKKTEDIEKIAKRIRGRMKKY